MRLKKAVILAAGRGTRRYPVTKTVPKELLPIGNVPAMDYCLQECIRSGIESVAVVISEEKDALLHYIIQKTKDDVFRSIHFSVIPQIGFGTGCALYSAKNFIGQEDFVVLFPDEIYSTPDGGTFELMSAYEHSPICSVLAQKIPLDEAQLYGIIETQRNDILNGTLLVKMIIEKPTVPISDLALCGRMILPPDIFTCLSHVKHHGKETYLTDALCELSQYKEIRAIETRSIRFDLGAEVGFVKANLYFSLMNTNIREGLKTFISEIKETV